tara:strand:- start:1599 stop:1946 length:348 start_codon:yes stop_codon:yes gene_type:complete
MEEFYDLVEHAIDAAFEKEMYLFKCYTYLKHIKATRKQVKEFIDSSTAGELALVVYDLDQYIKGGSDNEHQQLKEAYGHLGKPRARKIRKYLHAILSDAWQYELDRKPGRKKVSK